MKNRQLVTKPEAGKLYYYRGVERFKGELYGECEKVNNSSVQILILKMGCQSDERLASERGYRTIVPKSCVFQQV